jgi:hypothetical protein
MICDVARHGARDALGTPGSVISGNRALAAALDEALTLRPDALMAYAAFNATERMKMLNEFELKQARRGEPRRCRRRP